MLKKEDVEKVARLAKFNLSENEIEKFQKLLSQALDYVNVLDELDVSHALPTFQVTGKVNSLREDVAKPSLSQKDALSNAKEEVDGYFATELVIKK